MNAMAAIAWVELKVAMRNRWVILSSVVLAAFALVLGFVGAAPGGSVDANRLALTVASLATLSVYLIPLMALLLAFDAVAGEVERGTLPLLLAAPISRFAVLGGKFLAHLLVLALAITLGYGVAGIVVAGLIGGDLQSGLDMARLIATSIALGAVFLSIGYVASTLARQSGTAAALSVGIWLVAVVLYDLGLLGALVADTEGTFSRTVFPWLLIANPADAFRLFNMSALELGNSTTGFAGAASALPFPPAAALVSLAVWVCAALGLAGLCFRRLEP